MLFLELLNPCVGTGQQPFDLPEGLGDRLEQLSLVQLKLLVFQLLLMAGHLKDSRDALLEHLEVIEVLRLDVRFDHN